MCSERWNKCSKIKQNEEQRNHIIKHELCMGKSQALTHTYTLCTCMIGSRHHNRLDTFWTEQRTVRKKTKIKIETFQIWVCECSIDCVCTANSSDVMMYVLLLTVTLILIANSAVWRNFLFVCVLLFCYLWFATFERQGKRRQKLFIHEYKRIEITKK